MPTHASISRFWHQHPWLALLLAVVAGYLWADALPGGWAWLLPSVAALILVAVPSWRRRLGGPLPLAALATVSLAAGLYSRHTTPTASHVQAVAPDSAAPVVVQATLSKELRQTAFGHYTWVQLRAYRVGDAWQPLTGELVVYLPRKLAGTDTDWLVGSALVFEGQWSPLPDTGGYNRYLRQQGISHKLRVRHMAPVAVQGWQYPFAAMQHRLGQQLTAMLQPHNAALAKAILLGQRADLSREVRLQFAQSGVAHILALSGLHLSMLALLLGGAFRILPAGRWLWVQRVVVLVALAGYAVVTGLSPSVVRAVLMAAVLMLGYSLLRPVRILNVVAFCACLQLLLAPRLLFSLSFLLSYTAVIGLVTLGDSLQRLLQPRLKVLRYLWGTVVASVAAQLATLPFVLYYFGDFPLYFLLANLVLLPLMLVLMPLGLLLLLLGTVPYVGPLLALPFDYGLSFMQGFTAWVARLPGSGTLQLPLSALAAWLMGVGLVVLWQWLRLRTRRQLAEEDAAGIAEVGL